MICDRGEYQMGVIEEIFHGTLNPAEKIRSETDVYQDALAAAEKLARQLMDQLSPEQVELFENYCTEKLSWPGKCSVSVIDKE